MDSFDCQVLENINENNRKIFRIFLIILLSINIVYFILNLGDSQISGYIDRGSYFGTTITELFIGFIIILISEARFKRVEPFLGYVLILYTAIFRLIFLQKSQYTEPAILLYIAAYFIIASFFYYSYELVVSVIVTQLILLYILYSIKIDLYEILNTMIVTTLLLILSCRIAFSRLKHYKKVFKSEQQLSEGKELLNGILSRIDTLVILLKVDGTIYFVNTAFQKITGIEIKDKSFMNISEFFENESLQTVIEGFGYVLKHKKPYIIENHLIYKKNDQKLTLKLYLDYIELDENSFVMIAANDLTREAQLFKVKDIVIRLNNMLSKYTSLDDYFDDILRSLIEVMPYVELGSILLVDENDYMTMRANVGYDIDKAEKFKLHFKESFFYRSCGENITKPVIINDLASYSMEGVTEILDNIYEIQVASSLSSPIIIDGKLKGLLNLDSSKNNIFNNEDLEIMQFLTEQISLVLTSHQLLNQTIYLSRFDQLTGLYNRWYLNELETTIIPHSLKYKERFYYVMIDVNNLKMVNDVYGHVFGDVYLKEFSLLLKEHSRETDIFIRIGGDEFVGIYFDIDKDLLISKMKVINQSLRNRMKELGVIGECSFAYGAVAFPEESQKFDELIKIADQRMYVKKKEMKENNPQ